ncbi:MAG: DNA-directed RNA polymerase subunit omega [Clostridia bacterium]|nr:DNA-directed RNA polymerase subunit omega [Clostridia bacterium]
MKYQALNKLIKGNQTKYSLVIAAAKRARDISDKAVEEGEILNEKSIMLALGDIEDGRVTYGTTETEE